MEKNNKKYVKIFKIKKLLIIILILKLILIINKMDYKKFILYVLLMMNKINIFLKVLIVFKNLLMIL